MKILFVLVGSLAILPYIYARPSEERVGLGEVCDPNAEKPCDVEHAVCLNGADGPKCQCEQGYVEEGSTCRTNDTPKSGSELIMDRLRQAIRAFREARSGCGWRCQQSIEPLMNEKRDLIGSNKDMASALNEFFDSVFTVESGPVTVFGGGDLCAQWRWRKETYQTKDLRLYQRETITGLHKSGESVAECFRLLGTPRSSVYKAVKRFKELVISLDYLRSGRPATGYVPKVRKRMRQLLRRNPNRSMRSVASPIGISSESARKIAKDRLKLKPYKVQKVQLLTPAQQQAKLRKAKALLKRFCKPNRSLASLIIS
ncbi:unnamed protein product [Darwinula stevensoni]|uniref:EGF-like domain-containing protein n=1 Tax=Darwinula stevensoni TaxID=69355 RepID=A0A7R8XIM2_9CRUS|nr:unnamed protein product [Darwinula stevensoni]CAG0894431.1 unnamed protein product [Darwinula stevensoni]